MRFVLIALFILIHCSSYCATDSVVLRPAIAELVEKIAAHKIVEGYIIGYPGRQSEQWLLFAQLKKEATTDELLTLTRDKDAVLRCYSFEALESRKEVDLFPILTRLLYDTAIVNSWFGCMQWIEPTGDYILKRIIPFFPDTPAIQYSNKPTTQQINTIDSILVFDHRIRLYARNKLLRVIPPGNEQCHERLRELYTQEGNNYAVVALSKYRNQNDVGLIRAMLQSNDSTTRYYGLNCVRYFPDPAFFPLLQSIQNADMTGAYKLNSDALLCLYKAIVAYKDSSSRRLIETAIANNGPRRSSIQSEGLWQALKKNDNAVYKGLKRKVKLSTRYKARLKDRFDPAY